MMLLNANTSSKVQACMKARPCLPCNRLVMSRRCFVRATPEERSSEEAPQSTPSSGASATGAAAAAVALSKAPAEETSPFLDPLVRSLILGVGAGVLCETAHVVFKALTLFESGGLPSPFSSGALQQFSPAFIADHAVAIGAWLLLYAVEAAAIMGVMRRNPGKPSTEVAAQLSGLPLLPRKFFPASLTPVKDAVAHTLAASAASAVGSEAGSSSARSSEAVATAAILSAAAAGDLAQAQAVAAAAPSAIVASPPGLSKELEKTLDDIEAAAAGRVLDRPGAPQAEPVRPPQAGPDAPVRPPQAGPVRPKEQLQRRQQQQAAERGLSKRDKELRDRRSYLKNFWYAAALSDKVTSDKPLGVDILGSRLSLFRDESGKVVALDDACPHRGAPLSDGWTATDKDSGKKCVVCPYHGWAFDSSGKLRDVPSAEKGSWPKRPLVGSYAVEERGGFVWLFYGSPSLPSEERPPIPTTPELEDPAWRAVYGEIEFECGHWGVFENAIDMAHIHYLHGDSFGNSEKPKVMDMTSSRDTFETTCNFRIHNKPVNKLWEWTAVPSVPVTAKAMLPSTSAVTIELAHGVKMITFVNTVPINEHRAINRFCLIRNFATHPAFDWMARDNMYKILGEDKVMVDKLAPERLPAEYSLGPDLPQIAFRQLRQEWIDMGYGVPPESELPRRGLLP